MLAGPYIKEEPDVSGAPVDFNKDNAFNTTIFITKQYIYKMLCVFTH
jgi:hypothetical protein